MTFTARIEMDNTAFEPHPCAEMTRILKEIARQMHDGYQCAPVYDENGNCVGEWRIECP